jgi:hypothetical protein
VVTSDRQELPQDHLSVAARAIDGVSRETSCCHIDLLVTSTGTTKAGVKWWLIEAGAELSFNTVYLRRHDCDSAFDDRRVAVVAVFDLIDGHLALDDSRVGAGSSGWQEFTQDLGGDAPVGVGECLRGKNPGGLRSFAERPGGIW